MSDPTYLDRAKAVGAAWKASWPDLPDEARGPGSYEGRGNYAFVVPDEHRWLNLLPEAREVARDRFAAAGIRWHGDGHGPNPHTGSSQVQCLNALAPLVDRPEDLAWIFSGVLPIEEVVPFGAPGPSFEAHDHVVFEWQGLEDHLGEWGERVVRGARATSADAAFRYRSVTGEIELALVEWKYTESYPDGGVLAGPAGYQESRYSRYAAVLWGPEGVVRTDAGFAYEDLFAEPVYQLARTQALADQMERAGELGAARVRFVYAAPAANAELLERSLGAPGFERYVRDLGVSLPGAWATALRRPDRFVHLDTARLLDGGSPVAPGFRERYAPLAGG